MAMEKSVSKFGLLHDVTNVLKKVEGNVRVAVHNVHNLRTAVKAGKLGDIPAETLMKMLDETAEALDAISV